MELNSTIYLQQLKIEMKKRGLNPKGLLLMDYRNQLNFKQEREYHDAKMAAEKRTRELQEMFPGTLGIDTHKYETEWLADAIKSNKKLAMIVRT